MDTPPTRRAVLAGLAASLAGCGGMASTGDGPDGSTETVRATETDRPATPTATAESTTTAREAGPPVADRARYVHYDRETLQEKTDDHALSPGYMARELPASRRSCIAVTRPPRA